MIENTITNFTSFLVTNVNGLTTDNCKGFDDESIFDYITATDMAPYKQHGAIVSYGGARPDSNEMSEFGGLVVQWVVIVSLFYLMIGDDEELQEIKLAAHQGVDSIVNATVVDPTLGGTVMDTVLLDAEPPLEYVRSGVSSYLLMSIRFVVKENI